MIKITDPKDCCGCTACASICAHNAITMEPDVLGFLYPTVDESKCVDCGLCDKVCQFNDNYDRSLNLEQPLAYAARHKDIDEVMKSRSGAAFVAISDYILEQGGVVYGAGYKGHFRVAHKRATAKKERDEFRGSKYVQSDLTGIFRQVKEDLKNGLTVLFSGTPCQTSGLNSFVGVILRQNLILVDIVCHGTPSPFIWRDYVHYIESKNNKTIVDVNFRNKGLFGWKEHRETFMFDNNDILTTQNLYTSLFYKHIMLRHSCGVCHFTNPIRPSDITLADFWGWENVVPGFNDDDKGVSLVLLNTEKGKILFEMAGKGLEIIKVNLDDCLQPNLRHPSEIHPRRVQFEEDYKINGLRYVFNKYGEEGWRIRGKRKLMRIVNKVKKIIVRIENSLF